ncbi:hypothetical protein NX059_006504 [Plenodomus lindquistii]|nr:hypothetical protein NX059_006504 [Plenodomus lindquistii]
MYHDNPAQEHPDYISARSTSLVRYEHEATEPSQANSVSEADSTSQADATSQEDSASQANTTSQDGDAPVQGERLVRSEYITEHGHGFFPRSRRHQQHSEDRDRPGGWPPFEDFVDPQPHLERTFPCNPSGRPNNYIMRGKWFGLHGDEMRGYKACWGLYGMWDGETLNTERVCPYLQTPWLCSNNHALTQEHINWPIQNRAWSLQNARLVVESHNKLAPWATWLYVPDIEPTLGPSLRRGPAAR